MNQQLADLVRRHLTAENGQDLPGTLATLHADCRFEDLATGQTWRGHDGAAAHYGQVRAELERVGWPAGPHDMLIGAHARSAGLIVVTNNLREFERIPGLRTENWV